MIPGVKVKRNANLIKVEKEVPELWDVKRLSSFLGVSQDWIYRRTMEDAPDPIPHVKIGHFIRFVPAEIFGWLREREVR